MLTNEEDEKKNFLALKTRQDVGVILKIKPTFLNSLKFKKLRQKYYKSFQIRKRTGGERSISAPIPYLKIIQKRLSGYLYQIYRQKPAAHGFSLKRNILTNAKKHCQQHLVFNIDLENFFPSINFGRIRGILMSAPYQFPQNVATTLAQICSDEKGLPQGAPTSPIISNIICSKLDNQLQELARKNSFIYTRYADDITFSTNRKVDNEEIVTPKGGCGMVLKKIIEENGFSINYEKVYCKSGTQRKTVTGLRVNKENPKTSRQFTRRIRTLNHLIKKFGLEEAQRIFTRIEKSTRIIKSVTEGRINFVKFILGEESLTYQKIQNAYSIAVKENPRYPITTQEKISASLWVLECENKECLRQGTGFMIEGVVGIVTCEHVFCEQLKAFQPTDPSKKYGVRRLSKKHEVIDLILLEIIDFKENKSQYKLKYGSSETLKQYEEIVRAAGFPNYLVTHRDPIIHKAETSGRRMRSKMKLIVVNQVFTGGMSGGPLVNEKCQVVGVIMTGDKDDGAMNLAIPIESLTAIDLN